MVDAYTEQHVQCAQSEWYANSGKEWTNARVHSDSEEVPLLRSITNKCASGPHLALMTAQDVQEVHGLLPGRLNRNVNPGEFCVINIQMAQGSCNV